MTQKRPREAKSLNRGRSRHLTQIFLVIPEGPIPRTPRKWPALHNQKRSPRSRTNAVPSRTTQPPMAPRWPTHQTPPRRPRTPWRDATHGRGVRLPTGRQKLRTTTPRPRAIRARCPRRDSANRARDADVPYWDESKLGFGEVFSRNPRRGCPLLGRPVFSLEEKFVVIRDADVPYWDHLYP